MARRRFMIAITGTALVFAMTPADVGPLRELHARDGSHVEGDRWRRLGREGRRVRPIYGVQPGTRDRRRAGCRGRTGSPRREPIIYLHQTVGDEPKDINLFGVVSGALRRADGVEGTPVCRAPGEALADSTLGADVGEPVQMSGTRLRDRRGHEAHDAERRHRHHLHHARRRADPARRQPDRQRHRRDRRADRPDRRPAE